MTALAPSPAPRAAAGSEPAAGRYAHIDALRALAVLLVVLAHAGLGGVVPGGSGVTIFFAVSGFVITHVVLRERERTGRFAIGSFYLRRALKLGPPFLLVILLPTAVYAVVHGVAGGQVLSQVLFAFNWQQAALGAARPSVLPGSGVVWSLAIEEQFYLVFAVAWLALLAARPRPVGALAALCAAALVASITVRLVLALDPDNTWRIFYGSDTRMDSIALGALSAIAYARWRRDPSWAPRAKALVTSSWTPLAAALGYLTSIGVRNAFFQDGVHYLLQAVATCAFILWGLLAPRTPVTARLHRGIGLGAVQAIGLASYSVYLVHDPLFELLSPRLDGAPLPVRAAVLVLVGVSAGLVLYRLVEVPVAGVRARLRA